MGNSSNRAGTAASKSTDDLTERALIQRVAARDRQAFTQLYYRYAPRLGRYLWRWLQQREVVDETINDIMLVVWQSADRFDSSARLSTWIFGIAHNKALKALARSTRHPTEELPETVSAEDDSEEGNEVGGPSDPDDPERILLREDLSRTIAQALLTLPAEQRAVIELTYYEGFSYQEIAAIMDCPENTVKTRMFHARKRLAQVLAQ